ncbi:MAG: ATP-binding cassette domain-containing protein [Bifidobacterium psychraerophilum]|uniref:ATP-binding cassette domain-containing protein n=1 Tax=Bifidobacterium psychraerophilum TaxID=218140 RepID=UPI0039E97683
MIEIEHLSKRFNGKMAVDDVTFTAADGRVTGFLGPNGAGKSTTMRAALGLIKPSGGRALIDGQPFTSMRAPMSQVGAVLDAKSAHKGRSAYAHLLSLALSNAIPKSRVDEVIDITGIANVKKRRAGAFSLGMGQRLSIAAALLGDPHNLVLDEPINGLDPEGVRWVRELCRYYASQGRAVLLSSHLMSEVALTADDLVIIGQGRVLEKTSVNAFIQEHSSSAIRVATPDGELLQRSFSSMQGTRVEPIAPTSVDPQGVPVFHIWGATLETVARSFAQSNIAIYELATEHSSLEQAYMELTHAHVEYAAQELPGRQAATPVAARGEDVR